MRVSNAPRHALGGVKDFGRTLARGTARGRDRRGLDSQRPRDSIGIAGVQGQQQLRRLEVGTGDEIDQTEPDGRSPAGVDAPQIGFRNLARSALRELQSTPSELCAPKEEPSQRPTRTAWKPQANGPEHGAHHVDAALEVSAQQELLRGMTP